MHVSFINAGAELIETNTFGANRRKLAQHFLEDDFERINSTGVKLAREAREITGREVFIGGSIGPIGELAQRAEPFAEQARILEGRGADLFMLETFYDLDELERRDRGGPLGLDAADRRADELRQRRRDARRRLARATRASGCASSTSPRSARTTAAARPRRSTRSPRWRATAPSLAALPNVGLATITGARVAFPHATPEYFAEFAAHARALGARLIGGCCGTTPAQIAAIRAAVDENRASDAAAAGARAAAHERCRSRRSEPTELARLLAAGEFVVSVQLDPPLGGNADGLIDAAATHQGVGARAVRRRQRQPARPRPDERADGVGRDPARGRDRGRSRT